ncbi:hypothetical protein BDK92_6968 [Micromonospora pisi]|uniref:Galactose oxidase-like protein n=2 Tax=Micromonospora pisi TaxID=589240 RepID=A0A495JU40_9ACTN|nr:hypothetical protein BDK92_6968 [Micromonospora pisi]
MSIGGLLALGGCAPTGSAHTLPAGGTAGWHGITGAPLSPRTGALGLWTGREVLLVGGSDEPVCPPNADCGLDPTPLGDGAALDPKTGQWRRIVDSPYPFAIASGVVIGGTAYVLPGGWGSQDHPGLLTYDIGTDRWGRLAVPFAPERYGIAAAGDRLVAYLGTDEAGTGDDFVLDARTSTWQPLPDDPLGASFDRAVAWTGTELVLFGRELSADANGRKPAGARAAALDPAGGDWRRLPDSRILSTGPWLLVDGRLVNPTLGGADGGRVDNWGTTFTYGGVLDPGTGRWSALPDTSGAGQLSAGARGASTAVYVDVTGSVLETTTGRWIRVPKVPGGEVSGRTLVAAGADMLLFGGGRRDGAGHSGALIDQVWIWSGRS